MHKEIVIDNADVFRRQLFDPATAALAGKRDFEHSVTVAEGQSTRVVAPLKTLRVQRPARKNFCVAGRG
jgi:hypothetical protein